MKKLAFIPSFLLSSSETANLRLQNQVYMIIIPKKLLEQEISVNSELSFNLVVKNGNISLIGIRN